MSATALTLSLNTHHSQTYWRRETMTEQQKQLEMWANAQRDGRPAEYRYRPLFNAAKFG